jgi:hypothetical protein
MAPLLDFPYASDELYITDAVLDQRYFREATGWGDRASQKTTTRSRVYQGRARWYDFKKDNEHVSRDRTWMMREGRVRLRTPVVLRGDIFPVFTNVGGNPRYNYIDPKSGDKVTGKVTESPKDIPVGGWAGREDRDALVPLDRPVRVNTEGNVGIPASDWSNGPAPRGASWRIQYKKIPPKTGAQFLSVTPQRGEAAYAMGLSQGSVERHGVVARVRAESFGVAGRVDEAAAADELPADWMQQLPVWIRGVNTNWDCAVWREGGDLNYFGVFERRGRAELDITRKGGFYAGNVVIAGDRELRIAVLEWTPDYLKVEINNVRENQVQTHLSTAPAVDDLYAMEKAPVTVPGGGTKRIEWPR